MFMVMVMGGLGSRYRTSMNFATWNTVLPRGVKLDLNSSVWRQGVDNDALTRGILLDSTQGAFATRGSELTADDANGKCNQHRLQLATKH